MKTFAWLWASLLLVLGLSEGCRNQDADLCTSPQLVTTGSPCYSGNGLQLTAGDYGGKPLSFTWDVYALKDTNQVLGWSLKDEKIKIIASSSFVVPDSLATNYQRLIIRVAANCGGILKQSIYYSFIKRKSTNGACTTWVSQNQ